MKKYQLRDFEVFISDTLYPIYDGHEEIVVIFPDHSSVCCNVKISEKGTLLVDTFWGVDHIVSGTTVHIYYKDEEMEQ
ncbi:hypothetical protein [Streptococcus ruminantium]|uniref:hypothetical protein n=1 Tax=Streptococcus ruminantium TaxID=1917441 RepID=UPI0012DDEC2A|nr:hypothetical protein [Streptococcus ruminantium]